ENLRQKQTLNSEDLLKFLPNVSLSLVVLKPIQTPRRLPLYQRQRSDMKGFRVFVREMERKRAVPPADMAEPPVPVSVLTCRICSEPLRNPATVPCGHDFCLQCIQDFWQRESSCSCPECGQTFPSKPRLTRNSTPAEVLRGTEDRGSGKRKSLVQKTPRGEETSEDSVCSLHNGSLDVFCYTDEQILCCLCAIAEHAGHELGWVKEERKRKQEELLTLQKNLQQILQDGEKKRQKLSRVFNQIEDEAAQTQEYSESAMVRVIDGLQTRYLSLRETIAARAQTAASRVRRRLQTLEVKMDAVRRRRAELEALAQSASDRRFLQKCPSVLDLGRRERLTCDQDAENPLVCFEAMRRAVQQSVEKIQEFSDREFTSIFSEGLSRAPGIPKSPLAQTREELLQYACELSLDAATAHRDLHVSEGDKEVTSGSDRPKGPAPGDPQRFARRRQVLCREGLQAEQCYYEVEVKGEKAEIALTYRRIDRKSFSKLSAFGANDFSWSLDRSSTYSVSHASQSVQLTAAPSHCRVGVHLKLKEGALLFYEVHDSMKLLYKVEAVFTEPLYAGFWLGEKCRIKICDLSRRRREPSRS
ncbi:hypothetical protein OJAV_G00050000, partial [Oryzias javanicus]